MNDQDEECIGCGRFYMQSHGLRRLCALKETQNSPRCPCRDCIVKSVCSSMCNSRILLLDEILGSKRKTTYVR